MLLAESWFSSWTMHSPIQARSFFCKIRRKIENILWWNHDQKFGKKCGETWKRRSELMPAMAVWIMTWWTAVKSTFTVRIYLLTVFAIATSVNCWDKSCIAVIKYQLKNLRHLPIDQKHSPSVQTVSNRPSSSKGTWTSPSDLELFWIKSRSPIYRACECFLEQMRLGSLK